MALRVTASRPLVSTATATATATWPSAAKVTVGTLTGCPTCTAPVEESNGFMVPSSTPSEAGWPMATRTGSAVATGCACAIDVAVAEG